MPSPLQMLLDALDTKPLGEDRFEARSIEYLRPRVFGGELLAQVLAMAARTVQDRACHAIHVDFLFSGRSEDPDRVRRAARARRPALRAATSVRLPALARDRARNCVLHDGQRGRGRVPARANAGNAGPRGPDLGARIDRG
jgi:hypothetical protein